MSMANRLLAWIRTKISGRASPGRHNATAEQVGSRIEKWKSNARALLANEANWRLVRESLGRLEQAGLRINAELDRDLIVVRFLRSLANWFEGADLATFFSEQRTGVAGNSFDLVVLDDLAGDSDAFYDFDDIDVVLPKLSTVSEEDLNDVITAHSRSIFENAYTICIVNEHGPGEYVPQHVGELEALACGDFAVQSVTETATPHLLIGRVTLGDGQCASFEIGDEKRPDLTPLLTAMNSLIAHLDKGRFVAVVTGSGEGFIVLYLRPHEQIAFRDWSERQRFADGSIPGDWLE